MPRPPFLVVPGEVPPAVAPSSAGAQALAQTSELFFRASEAAQKQLNREAIASAKQNALQVVEETGRFKPARRTGLFWEAYNQTGMAAFAQEAERLTREAVARIGVENRLDPAAMDKAMTSWRDGFMPELPIEMRAAFRNDFEKLSRPYVTKAMELQLKRATESAADGFEALRRSRNRTMRDAAAMIGDVDLTTEAGLDAWAAAIQAMADTQDTYVSQLFALQQQGLITEGAAALALSEGMEEALVETIYGLFEGTPDKEGMLVDLLEGRLRMVTPLADANGMIARDPRTGEALPGELRDVSLILDNDQLKAVTDFMMSNVTRQHQLADRQDDLRDEAAQDAKEARIADWLRDPTNEDLRTAVLDDPTLSISEYNSVLEISRNMFGGVRDDRLFFEYMRDISLHPETWTGAEIWGLDGVTFEDKQELYNEWQEALSDGYFAKRPEFEEAETKITQVIEQQTGTAAVVLGQDVTETANSRRVAAALMNDALRDEYRRHRAASNAVIGRNRSGLILDVVMDANTGERVVVFDPILWVEDKVAPVEQAISSAQARLEQMEADVQRLLAEANQEPDQAKAVLIRDRAFELRRQKRNMRSRLNLESILREQLKVID